MIRLRINVNSVARNTDDDILVPLPHNLISGSCKRKNGLDS